MSQFPYAGMSMSPGYVSPFMWPQQAQQQQQQRPQTPMQAMPIQGFSQPGQAGMAAINAMNQQGVSPDQLAPPMPQRPQAMPQGAPPNVNPWGIQPMNQQQQLQALQNVMNLVGPRPMQGGWYVTGDAERRGLPGTVMGGASPAEIQSWNNSLASALHASGVLGGQEMQRQQNMLQAGPEWARSFGMNGTPGSIQNQAGLAGSEIAQRMYNISSQGRRDQLVQGLLAQGASPDEAMRGAERLIEGGFLQPFAGSASGGAQNPMQGGGVTAAPQGGAATPLQAGTPGLEARGGPGSSQRVLADRFDEVMRRLGTAPPGGRGPMQVPRDPQQLNQSITEFITGLPGGFLDNNIRDASQFMINRFGGVPMDQWFTQRFSRLGPKTPQERARDALIAAFNRAGGNVGTSSLNPQTQGLAGLFGPR